MSRINQYQQPTARIQFTSAQRSLHAKQNSQVYANDQGKYQRQRQWPTRWTIRGKRQNYDLNSVMRYNHFRIF